MSIFIYVDKNLLFLFKEKMIFFNSFLEDFREKTFLRYFKSKVIKKYEDTLNKNSCLLLPKDAQLTLKRKILLKKPNNILKYPNDFSDIATVVYFKENNLTDLNRDVASFFKKGYYKDNIIYIITNRKDLFFYEDIVKGINSKKIKFFKQISLNKVIEDVLNLYLDKNLKTYLTAFKVGTTAILDFFKEKSNSNT